MTRYWLVKITAAFTIGFLYCTITIAFIIVTSKHTVFAIHDRSNQISLRIGIDDSLLIDYRTSFRRKFVPYNRKYLFQLFYFFQLYRSTSISFNAALSLTGIEITNKLLTKYIQTDYYIIYLYHFLFIYIG